LDGVTKNIPRVSSSPSVLLLWAGCATQHSHIKAESGAAHQPMAAPELNPSAETSMDRKQH